MIAGHGAFGVENIRTCCEFSAKRIYMVCRRTNLACPRVSSWFCNQSDPAVPAPLFLESMEPAYKLIGYDPWSYHSVTYNAARTTAQINQKARFGIGDVYFLALSMGKCEVIVDEVKRLSEGRVHLQSGRELSVQTILKVFGFVGDQEVDRLLKIKSMYGYWADADNRRFTASENPGVYASNFGGTSLSPGAIFFTLMASHVMWFPRDWQRLVDSVQLPTNKRDDSISRPAYVLDAKTALPISFVVPTLCPGIGEIAMRHGALKKRKQLECHPLERFLEECQQEWDEYARKWKADDPSLKDPPAYPYSVAIVKGLLAKHAALVTEQPMS